MQQLSLKQCHERLLEILKAVDKFCKNNDIKYSLAYGTLLGAVRHKGFIPWDDDVDLMMARPDFERFIATFSEQENGRYRVLFRVDNSESRFIHYFAKVEDTTTVCHQGRNMKDHYGIALDIFPVDGKSPDSSVWPTFEKRMTSYAHRLNICGTRFSLLSFNQPIFTKISAHLHGPQYWVRKMDEEMRQYDYNTSEYAGTVSTIRNGTREVFKKEMLEKFTLLEFEGCMFPAYSDWDAYLTQQYNDYMQLPPLSKRKAHGMTAYVK